MLCYRCGSHVPESSESCPNCGQQLKAGVSRGGVDSGRKRPSEVDWEGAPYKQDETIADRYLVLSFLGRGPFGWVLKARDKELEVDVAIKIVNPGLVKAGFDAKQFSKALRFGRKLSHQNLVRLFEEGEDKDNHFYTFQAIDGLSLRSILDSRLAKGQLFSLEEAEPILAQVCLALEEIHKLGAHTDLKPENITVMPDLLKVGDYGLGQALPRRAFLEALEGKPAYRYLSQEAKAGKEMDRRSDVFAYGVLLGEMLGGVLPEKDVPHLVRFNPRLSEDIQRIYERALSREPRKRYSSITELFAEMTEAIQKPPAPPPLPVEIPSPLPVASEQEKTEITDPIELQAALDKSTGETEHREAFEGPPSVPAPTPHAIKEEGTGSRASWFWLVLLTVLGLGLGAFVGDWMLTSPSSSPPSGNLSTPHKRSP